MAREKFEDRKLTGIIRVACKNDDGTVRYWEANKEDVVRHISQIARSYAEQGYPLTLRQLHYQLVSKNWIVNHDTAYKKLGTILDDCRYSGIVDWSSFEDRGRVPFIPYSVKDIPDALQDTIDQYRIDRQRGQENLVEVWTEKDALSGIFKRTTVKYHVRLVVNKGYTSSSAAYESYHRIVRAIKAGQRFTILYFGDHDPSGLDMVRDIRERLEFFLCRGLELRRLEEIESWWLDEGYTIYDAAEASNDNSFLVSSDKDISDKAYDNFEAAKVGMYLKEKNIFNVVHIGLSMEQIKKYNLPPNPTKMTDTRSDKYIAKYGKTCWEVDALTPQVLTSILESHIVKEIDVDQYDTIVAQEEGEIEQLKVILDNTINPE